MEFQAYIPKIHSNNEMLKWNLRIGIQAVFLFDWEEKGTFADLSFLIN
jgi:hypothetical protein